MLGVSTADLLRTGATGRDKLEEAVGMNERWRREEEQRGRKRPGMGSAC